MPSIVALLVLFHFWTISTLAYNATTYTLDPKGKFVECGFYSVRVQMWADTADGWLYITDKDCDPVTGQPCGPPDTPSLADLNCVGRLSCDRSTPQTYSVPLCVVVANLSPSAQLTFDVEIMGSYQPPSSGGKGGLTTLEIVLIAVGAGAGGLMLLGCVVLVSYLACFRTPPVAQVLPGPADDMAAFAAKSLAALPAYPPGMGPTIMSGTMTILPPPGALGIPPYIGAYSGGAVPPVASEVSPTRTAPVLVPLPPEAYGKAGQPPGQPPLYTAHVPAAQAATPHPQDAQGGQPPSTPPQPPLLQQQHGQQQDPHQQQHQPQAQQQHPQNQQQAGHQQQQQYG